MRRNRPTITLQNFPVEDKHQIVPGMTLVMTKAGNDGWDLDKGATTDTYKVVDISVNAPRTLVCRPADSNGDVLPMGSTYTFALDELPIPHWQAGNTSICRKVEMRVKTVD